MQARIEAAQIATESLRKSDAPFVVFFSARDACGPPLRVPPVLSLLHFNLTLTQNAMVLSPRPPNSASSSSPLCSGSQDLDLIDMDIDVPIDVDLDSDVDEDRTDLLAVSPETPTSNGPVSFDALSAHAQLQAILKLLSLVEWPVLYDSLECDVLVRSVSDRLSESSYHARRTLADLSDLATLFALDREKVAVSTGAVVVGGISWPETTCTTECAFFSLFQT